MPRGLKAIKTLAREAIEGLFWSLPYESRRWLVRKFRPRIMREFDLLRADTDEKGYSMTGFIEKKCIFVHIPKCAGISVLQGLFGNKGAGHTKIERYMLAFDRKDFEGYFKFTFVRNPWDRLVSAFHFLKKGGMTDEDRRWSEQNLSPFETFEEFVFGWLTEANAKTEVHFEPQYRFVCYPNNGPLAVDFVGKYENLDEDYAKICKKLSIDRPLSKLNVTPGERSRYADCYSDKTREIVGRVYEKDIALFGYRF